MQSTKMTLKEVFISSIELQIGGSDDSDDEIIKLRFTEFVEEFVPQKPDGSGGGAVKHGYNITRNTKNMGRVGSTYQKVRYFKIIQPMLVTYIMSVVFCDPLEADESKNQSP